MRNLPLLLMLLAAGVAGTAGCKPAAPPEPEPESDSAPSMPSQPVAAPRVEEREEIIVPDLPGMAAAPPAPTAAAPDFRPAPSAAHAWPDVVARIGDETITRDEFQNAITELKRMMHYDALRRSGGKAGLPPDFELDETGIDQLVNMMVQERIVLHLCRKAGIEVSDEEVQTSLEKGKSQVGSEEAFEQVMKATNMTLEELKARIREQILTSKFFATAAKAVIVTEEEIEQEYAQLKEEGRLDKPETCDFAHILVRADHANEASSASAKAKIEAARERIVNGEDFGQVASEVSEDIDSVQRGGVYEGMQKRASASEFEAQVFALPVGELSEPIKAPDGWHLVTVLARHESTPFTLDEVKSGIQQELIRRKGREAIGKSVEDAKKELGVDIMIGSAARKTEAPESESTDSETDASETERSETGPTTRPEDVEPPNMPG